MKSTDEEIEKNSKLVRDVIESQRVKREAVLKFKELFEKKMIQKNKSKQNMMKGF